MPGFTLNGKIRLDGSQWQAGLHKAKGEANKWSNEVSNMIRGRLLKAFAVFAGIRGVDQKTARAGQIRDQSSVVGLDIETFQKVDFAAQQSAASVDDVAKAIKRLSTSSLDALRGSKDILEAFGRFGITAEQLSALKSRPGDLLFLLADLVEKGVNPTALGDLQKIAGRSAPTLLPSFKAGFAQAGVEAEREGVIMPAHKVRELAALGDAITTKKFLIDRVTTDAMFNAIETGKAVLGINREAAESRATFRHAKRLEQQLEEAKKASRLLEKVAENTKPLNQ